MPSPIGFFRVVARGILCVAAFAACEGTEQQAQPQTPSSQVEGEAVDDSADMDPAALSDFREPLVPYGTWVDDPTYGTVWVPSAEVVGPDFVPYFTAGASGPT